MKLFGPSQSKCWSKCLAMLAVISMQMLSACSTLQGEVSCPTPPALLLLPPPELPPLPPTLTERQAVEAWLSDVEVYRVTKANYTGLQEWVVKECLKK